MPNTAALPSGLLNELRGKKNLRRLLFNERLAIGVSHFVGRNQYDVDETPQTATTERDKFQYS